MKRRFALIAMGLAILPQLALSHPRRSLAPSAAPASWVAYAAQVNALVQSRLTRNDGAAEHLRALLAPAVQSSPDGGNSHRATVLAMIWVDRTGHITRADLDDTVDETVRRTFSSMLIGTSVGTQPPKRMAQPLRLAVDLDAAQEAGD